MVPGMQRTLAAAALSTLLILQPSPAQPADTGSWIDHLQAGRAAFARDDRAAARSHLHAVDSLVGGHPGAITAFAVLAAREGRRDEALAWLRALAAMRLARPALVDTAFALWGGDPAFRAVAARFRSNTTPRVRSTVGHSLTDTLLLAEDVTWDARTKRFLVSSIHRRKIVAIDAAGAESDFTTPGADGVWGIYGLALDAPRRLLWAATAAGPECETDAAADSGRTALVAYDLDGRGLVRRIELAHTPERQVLGDLAVAPDGTVYASESLRGSVVRLRPGASQLEVLVPRGTLRSPQQPAPAADGRRLFVADYSRGIAAIDVASGVVTWLRKPRTLASGGIDGLVRIGNRLLAVQNGTDPHRVLELTLDARGAAITGWRVLDQGAPRLGEPNHGVVVGSDFWFIGDSGWDRVGDDGRLQSSAAARPPVLLRLPLAAGR